MISATIKWLNDPLNWSMAGGIREQLVAHLRYSFLALLISMLIGLPIGMFIGHSGRAKWVVSTANALRSLPTIGVLILLYVIGAPHFTGPTDTVYLVPTEIVLILLATPPILANTAAGVANVDPVVRDAARGMGMTDRQSLLRVELPNALPLIFSGVRSAALQTIATATVAAYVGLGGLGRFVYDGQSQNDVGQRTGGAVLVAVLAVVVDVVLALIQRSVVSRGVSGRFRRRALIAQVPSAGIPAAESESELAPAGT